MKIRKMQRNDVEIVYEQGRKEKMFHVAENTFFWGREELLGWVKSRDDVLLVAEHEKRVIGHLLCMLHNPTRTAKIENLFVDESFRKRGVGSDLIRECMNQLKNKGIRYVSALVKPENKSSSELLKSFGFKTGYGFTWMEKYL